MKTVYKFPLETTDLQSVEMPIGAEILTIQTQNERACIWALVDVEQPLEKRHFEMFGTGHPVPANAERKYIGTFQMSGGRLVFHCFELFKLI